MHATIRHLSDAANPVYSVGRRARDRARLNRVFPTMRRSQTFADISAAGLAVAAAAAWSGSAYAAAHSAGDVTEARITTETPGDNWLVKGGSFAQQQFSPLREINDKNVAHLGLAWIAEMDDPMGLAAEPIVVDGVTCVALTQLDEPVGSWRQSRRFLEWIFELSPAKI